MSPCVSSQVSENDDANLCHRHTTRFAPPSLAENLLESSQPPAQSRWCRLHTKEKKVNKRWQEDKYHIKFITHIDIRVRTSKVIIRYQGYEARDVSKNNGKNQVNKIS